MLKKLMLMLTFFVIAAGSVAAQSPPNEAVTGYTYLRGDELNTDFHGFNFAYTRYLNDKFGLTAEVGANFTDGAHTVTYLFGPQVAGNRNGRVSPFAHILLGGANVDIEREFSLNGFAVALGGGVDVKLTEKISLRVIQIDYLPIRFENGTIHNGRVGVGLNFRF